MTQCRDCGELQELDELTNLCYFCAKIYSDEEQDWEKEKDNGRYTTCQKRTKTPG